MSIEVVYDPRLLAPAQGHSPSAAKPAAVVEAWQRTFPTLLLLAPQPVSEEVLSRAHDRRCHGDVLEHRMPNGFGTVDAQIITSLPYTSGAMLTAARSALRTGRPVAAPCSGFHHARWDFGGDLCTFNGLMVPALGLHAKHPELRIGILDYDYHYGNGTDHILESLKPSNIVHVTAGADWRDSRQAVHRVGSISHGPVRRGALPGRRRPSHRQSPGRSADQRAGGDA